MTPFYHSSNPFARSAEYKSGRRFFGREEELATLSRNIDSGNHTGLFGLRKIGKTSLLKQLQEKRPQDLVVYIDLQDVPGLVKDCTYLYWNISNELKTELAKKYPQVAQNLHFSLAGRYQSYASLPSPNEVAIAYDSDLYVIRNALTQLENGNQVKVLLLLDELEQMLPNSSQPTGWAGYIDFFRYLRGISQQTGFITSIITAANPTICEEPHLEGQDNPIFQFYQEMYLPPLEPHECFEMVEKLGKGMGVTYSKSSLEQIYQETGGHPLVTRQLCSLLTTQLFPERPLKVDRDKVKDATEEFLLHETSIFREILARLERDFPQEKDLLLFIADGVNNITELSQLCQTSVGNTLGHLIGYQLIVREGTTYRIKMDLLLKWIRRHWLNVED